MVLWQYGGASLLGVAATLWGGEVRRGSAQARVRKKGRASEYRFSGVRFRNFDAPTS